MNSDEDRDLREAFATLRREEHAHATPHAAFMRAAGRPRSRPRRYVLAPVLAGVALVAVLGIIVDHEWHKSRAPVVEIALANWIEPTAFLLNTPGQELLRTVPAFGRDPPSIVSDAPAPRLPSHVH